MKTTNRWALAAAVAVSALLPACATDASKSNASAAQTRAAVAKARFDEHCKRAGEKVYKTVEGVEGVFLMKIRETDNFSDQFALDDPYGHDSTGDRYISSFLRELIHAPQFRAKIAGAPPRLGYLYVEAIDPKDGQRYRYTGRWYEPWQTNKNRLKGDMQFALDRAKATGPAPRYGVTYEDLSTHEDREYWIAGSALRVIDLQTNEVLAERIGYMWDPGQGSRSGGRSPWLLAANYACPGFQRNPYRPIEPGRGASAQAQQTEDFVEKILIPKVEK